MNVYDVFTCDIKIGDWCAILSLAIAKSYFYPCLANWKRLSSFERWVESDSHAALLKEFFFLCLQVSTQQTLRFRSSEPLSLFSFRRQASHLLACQTTCTHMLGDQTEMRLRNRALFFFARSAARSNDRDYTSLNIHICLILIPFFLALPRIKDVSNKICDIDLMNIQYRLRSFPQSRRYALCSRHRRQEKRTPPAFMEMHTHRIFISINTSVRNNVDVQHRRAEMHSRNFISPLSRRR